MYRIWDHDFCNCGRPCGTLRLGCRAQGGSEFGGEGSQRMSPRGFQRGMLCLGKGNLPRLTGLAISEISKSVPGLLLTLPPRVPKVTLRPRSKKSK